MSTAVIPVPDQDTQIAAMTAALATAKAELAARDLLIETLRVQIARTRRMAFGASSEKPSAKIAQLELALEELEVAATVTALASPVRGQPPDIRPRARQDRTMPLIADLRTALDDTLRRLSPKSVTARAIVYGTKRWTAPTRFLDDGRLEIDNNTTERSLRGIVVGRRNWLFAGSRVIGERAAAICTVIETCKMNGVDPHAFIADVIAKIAADWPAARWDELIPWNRQQQAEPARLAARPRLSPVCTSPCPIPIP